MRPDLLIGLVGVVLMGAGGAGAWVLLSAGEALAEIEYSVGWERAEGECEEQSYSIPHGGEVTYECEVPRGNVTLFEASVRCTDDFAGAALAPATLTVTIEYNGTEMASESGGCGSPVVAAAEGPCADPGSQTVRASSPQDAIGSSNVTQADCPEGMGTWTVTIGMVRNPGVQSSVSATASARYEYYHTPSATAASR